MGREPRRPPPDADARRAHIEAHGLVPGSRVRDTDLEYQGPSGDRSTGGPVFAVVVFHTASAMTRIRYEDADVARRFGTVKLCNPTRLAPAPKETP